MSTNLRAAAVALTLLAGGFLLVRLPRGTSAVLAGQVPTPTEGKVDVHTHFGPEAADRMVRLMDSQGISTVVNLSGGAVGEGLEQQLTAAARHPGRIVVFAQPEWWQLRQEGYGERMAQAFERAVRKGARGMKIFKGLGLGLRNPKGERLPVDDPGLDPLFEAAGRLRVPVAIHTGDPRAFWEEVTPANERFEELSVHPNWSLWGHPVPGFEAMLDEFERRVARHPKTTFIGVHFGNAAELPDRVEAMLAKLPNLYVDTSARVPELGRHNPARMRALFARFPDRILFGTDVGVGALEGQTVLGSPGPRPSTPGDVQHFFQSTWRYFETNDLDFAHPTPIQGKWTIRGLGLPPELLQKLYRDNAARVLEL